MLPTNELLTTFADVIVTMNRAAPLPAGELLLVKLQAVMELVIPVNRPRTPPAPTPVLSKNLTSAHVSVRSTASRLSSTEHARRTVMLRFVR